jgi:hypothetical protein
MLRDHLIGLAGFVSMYLFLSLWGLRDLPSRSVSTLSLVIGFLVWVIYRLEAELKRVKKMSRAHDSGHDAA